LFDCSFSHPKNINFPNVVFASICASFWTSKAHSISKPFKLAMHMLGKHMQVMTKSSMWCNGMPTSFLVEFWMYLSTLQKFFSLTSLYKIVQNSNVFYIFVVHPSHLGNKNKTIVALDKWHFILTYEVIIHLLSHDFLHFFLKKSPIMDTSYPPLIIIPKQYIASTIPWIKCGVKPFSTIIWFYVHLRCKNWNMTTIYSI